MIVVCTRLTIKSTMISLITWSGKIVILQFVNGLMTISL